MKRTVNVCVTLRGQQIESRRGRLEDSATTDAVAAAKATKLVEHDHVDVIFGGIYSSTRQGQSNTRGRKATRSSSVLARCQRSRLTRSFPG